MMESKSRVSGFHVTTILTRDAETQAFSSRIGGNSTTSAARSF